MSEPVCSVCGAEITPFGCCCEDKNNTANAPKMKFELQVNTIAQIDIADFANQLAHGSDDEQAEFFNTFCRMIDEIDANSRSGMMQSYLINEKITPEAKRVLERICES